MFRRMTWLAAVLVAVGIWAGPATAAPSESQKLVARAAATLERLASNENFRERLQPMLSRARAVLIVPHLVKAGFVLGGEYGEGVMLTRGPDGWSHPAFYALASGSLGLQAGIQDSEVIFIVMTDRALQAILANSLKLGADVGVAFLTIGGGLEASTTTNMRADIYAFSHSVGFFGGGALEGAVIKPLESWNRSYYRRGVTPADILIARTVANPGADRLRDLLRD